LRAFGNVFRTQAIKYIATLTLKKQRQIRKIKSKILQEKAVETIEQKGARRKETHTPTKLEEQEGMPQRQHCPPEKPREDNKPKHHE
jgi:hypothetical protein